MSDLNKFKFDKDKITLLSANIASVNILTNIESYNDEMTISQVVRFFDRHGLNFTKTMIQNYVRVGLIPPPVEKRYYTKKHLILLSIIDSLKDIYSLEEIGKLFKPIFNDLDTFDDDVMDIGIIYNEFYKFFQKSINDWAQNLPELLKDVSKTANESVSSLEDVDKASFFLSLMALMTQSIATKQLAKIIMKEQEKSEV